ncbi:putative bifunctional diguanylate cyclase/phosphodiesterase [Roseomonas sp. GCM10028921]
MRPSAKRGEERRCEACSRPLWRGDALTELADRAEFRARLEEALTFGRPAPLQPASQELAVLLIDLDRFKAVNDNLGHAAGDALLRHVGVRLRSALRDADLAARLGGDEFAVLIEGLTGQEAISRVAARLVDLLSRPYLIDGCIAHIGASIGIAFARPGSEAELVLRRADLALYKAKADGRGRFHFFEQELEEAAEARRALEFDLRAALALGQFELFYQPQVDLAENCLAGFEALIRWHHPQRGLVPPDRFVPLAEELGLMDEIGEWVLREACTEAMRWPDALTVAVNVAVPQFASGTLVKKVATALSVSGLPSSRLELEVTESVLLSESRSAIGQLAALKALGVQVSLDDFGTGYSSLTQLRSFPFDRVKIDRAFADDPAVVRAIAALGTNLGMRTTIEGVETAEQMERVRSEGCTEAQGFLLSKPVPATEVAELIARLGERLAGIEEGVRK